MNAAARAEHGKPLPETIDGVAFVMALLTYMAVPKRIGVAGMMQHRSERSSPSCAHMRHGMISSC